jgi:signal transduction histidine kinase
MRCELLRRNRETIKAHGGTLTVQSAPGQGTTWTITLPALSEALSMLHPLSS